MYEPLQAVRQLLRMACTVAIWTQLLRTYSGLERGPLQITEPRMAKTNASPTWYM